MKSQAPTLRPCPIPVRANIPWEPVARGDLTECLLAAYDAVARRAYQIFRERGQQPGGELGDWLKAEKEILQKIQCDVLESDLSITALASVPGFRGHEIEVAVEPEWMAILGRHEIEPGVLEAVPAQAADSEEEHRADQLGERAEDLATLAAEFCYGESGATSQNPATLDRGADSSSEFELTIEDALDRCGFGRASTEKYMFCVVQLPAPVDPSTCCAVLHEGLLGIRMLKATPARLLTKPSTPGYPM